MTRIEVVVVVTAASLLYLAIFGPRRRKSTSFFSQAAVLAAYTLFPSLLSNALGSMQSSLVKSSMYPVWAISLYVLFSDSITAYSLIDHRQSKRLAYRFLLDSVYLMFIAASISATAASSVGFVLVYVLYVIAWQKFVYRVFASGLAVSSWNFNKMVADHMDQEHIKNKDYDAASMRGYRYLVDWPLRHSKLEADISYAAEPADAAQVVDIEGVFLSQDKSLSPELKDTCLSFSLCHLLRIRFYGFAARSKSAQKKTRDLVFKGLLCKTDATEAGDINYKRVFKVIEVELAFTYDFFFTKRAVLYYGSWAATFWSFASASLMSVAIYLTVNGVMIIVTKEEDMDLSSLARTSTLEIDYFITLVIFASIVLLEVLHQLASRTSIWGRISFVCQRVRQGEASKRKGGRSCCMKFLCIKFKEVLVWIGVHVWTRSSCWKNNLGQYSLLESVHTTTSACSLVMFSCVAPVQKLLNSLFLGDYAAFVHPTRHRVPSVRKPGKPIELDEEVKKALVNFLAFKFITCVDGKIILENGRSSLKSNRADHLKWACDHKHWGSTICKRRKENQVYYILTWHIATWYCEMGALKYGVGEEVKVHLGVATKLSKYCAYLVAFAPKLLRGHHYDTRSVFDAVAAEAFESLKNKKDKYTAMTRLLQDSGTPPPGSKEKIFNAGVRLARDLEDMEVGARWKVLADFWTEMTLYIAKSGNNMEEHIEYLAKGGEFVTHLWALLFHAGIIDQEEEKEKEEEEDEEGNHMATV
ncbi:unnamed protein product [Urochloa decumbens]|uniref:DUF4220 domain-containing protein n=1 Tax=Urochloa decumbens TaxID=240449 RepID=A0ABC9GEV4_9POAL